MMLLLWYMLALCAKCCTEIPLIRAQQSSTYASNKKVQNAIDGTMATHSSTRYTQVRTSTDALKMESCSQGTYSVFGTLK